MKKNDLQTIREKDIKDLIKSVADKKLELSKMFVKIQDRADKNVKKSANLKKEIAQISTIIREKEIISQESK